MAREADRATALSGTGGWSLTHWPRPPCLSPGRPLLTFQLVRHSPLWAAGGSHRTWMRRSQGAAGLGQEPGWDRTSGCSRASARAACQGRLLVYQHLQARPAQLGHPWRRCARASPHLHAGLRLGVGTPSTQLSHFLVVGPWTCILPSLGVIFLPEELGQRTSMTTFHGDFRVQGSLRHGYDTVPALR